MAGWKDLPNELASHILRILASELPGQRQLVDIMGVCHRFHALLEPIVYATPRIHSSTHWVEGQHRSQQVDNALLRSFVHTVTSRPSLGLLVKELVVWCDGNDFSPISDAEVRKCNLQYDEGGYEDVLNDLPRYIPGDIEPLVSAAAKKGLPNGLVLRGFGPGLLVLLLHYLPSLTSFWAECELEMFVVAEAASGRMQGGIPIGLQTITHLNLTCRSTLNDPSLSLNSVIPFMLLPSLAKISCSRLMEWGSCGLFSSTEIDSEGQGDLVDSDRTAVPGFRPQSSPVTRICLDNGSLDNVILGLIIGLPRRLESFCYSTRDRDGHFGKLFEPNHIYQGLWTHKDSLMELCIMCERDMDEDDGILGSLSNFTVLRHLRLPATALLPFSDEVPTTPSYHNPLDSLLPPSLAILEMSVDDHRWLGEFVARTGLPDTLRNTAKSLPELRIFGISGFGDGLDWFDLSLDRRRIWPNATLWSVGHNIQLIALHYDEVVELSELSGAS